MKLRDYQVDGARWLAEQRYGLLADQMRLGKTYTALEAARLACARQIVVICPAIAVAEWKRQFDEYCPASSARPPIIVVSYDKFVRADPHKFDRGLTVGNSVLILDEAHYLKSREAKRTKLIYGNDGLHTMFKHVWALTGTPVTRDARDLYPILRAAKVWTRSFDDYLDEFCVWKLVPVRKGSRQKRVAVFGTKNKLALRYLLGKIMLRRTVKQVAGELGVEPRVNVRTLPQSDKRVDFDSLTPEKISDLSRVEVAAVKVPVLADEIAESLDLNVYDCTVVFGWHLGIILGLSDALNARGISHAIITGSTPQKERVDHVRKFMTGKIQVLIGNVLAMGTAIDLSRANHGYFLEYDWLPSNNKQASFRLLDLRNPKPSSFDVLVLEGTNDEAIARHLFQRSVDIKSIVEGV